MNSSEVSAGTRGARAVRALAAGSLAAILVAALAAWEAGCSSASRCMTGASEACACESGGMGAQLCQADGTLSPCSCSSGAGTGTGTGSGSTTSGSTDPCASHSDCTKCATQATCLSCAQDLYPQGEMAFQAYYSCAVCNACRVVCGTTGCTNPPPSPADTCEMGATGFDSTACQTCLTSCASSSSSCSSAYDACGLAPGCDPYWTLIRGCPKM